MSSPVLEVPEVPKATLQAAEGLGLFHPTATRIQEVASDPTAEISDLARTVAIDPFMSARLLKLANSPFYGMRKSVTTLKHAITVLGFRTTRDLAIAMYIGGKADTAGPEACKIWQHSLRTGTAYRLIARYIRGQNAPEALVAGILHDVGALIMCMLDPRYAAMCRHFQEGSARVLTAERMLFGVEHTKLGAALLDTWELPHAFVEVALTHHDPPETTQGWMMNMAEALAEDEVPKLDVLASSVAARKLRLTPSQLEIMIDVYLEDAERIDSLMR
jgi:HD-like signal output (HDOD) protein